MNCTGMPRLSTSCSLFIRIDIEIVVRGEKPDFALGNIPVMYPTASILSLSSDPRTELKPIKLLKHDPLQLL